MAILIIACLPMALLWPQREDARRLPATIGLVPQDADWFLLSDTLADMTSLVRRHLDHIRAEMGGKNGWPTQDGADNQEKIDEKIDNALGGRDFDYRALLCLLNQSEATLKINGLTGDSAAAIYQKDDRIHLLVPATDQAKALNYIFAGLTHPALNITFSYEASALASAGPHHVSLRVSGNGYRPCGTFTSASGTDGGSRLSIEGTFLPSKSADDFKIRLVRVIGGNSARNSVDSICEISGNAAACRCKLSMIAPDRKEIELQSCTGSDDLALPITLPSETDITQFESGLPIRAGAYLIEKYDRYLAISPRRGQSPLLEKLEEPTITLGGDRAFQTAILSLGSRGGKQARIFGGIRPTSGMHMQSSLGLPAIPLYLTTPVAIFADDNEISASLNLNLAPQDMELLKLLALKPASNPQKGEWGNDAGSGVRLSFNDPSLRSYPKLLNLVLPELAEIIQSEGRIYPIFFDLLDSGVSTVSFFSLKRGATQATPMAVVTSYSKNDLADALRLIGELSRMEGVRRNSAIISTIKQYLDVVCVLGELSATEQCDSTIPSFASRMANGSMVQESNNETVSKLACLQTGIEAGENSLATAVIRRDTAPFGSMLLGKAASFETEPGVVFAKSMDADTSPAEQLWGGLYAGGSPMSASNLQERKQLDFQRLLSSSVTEDGSPVEKDEARLEEDLVQATRVLNESRRYWNYALTGQDPNMEPELTFTRLDDLIRLWRSVMADKDASWSAKRDMLEGLTAQGSELLPAWNKTPQRLGLLAWLVSLPTIEEIEGLCAQARNGGVEKQANDQQLQVASTETSDTGFALIFYEQANAPLIGDLKKALAQPKRANGTPELKLSSKLSAAMDGTSLLSSEDDLRADLEDADMVLPYRLLTIDLDGLESGTGLVASISLQQRADSR
ncbi:MAG: hypothetical protein ACOZAM_29130 [Pseudomonadota bacterium]